MEPTAQTHHHGCEHKRWNRGGHNPINTLITSIATSVISAVFRGPTRSITGPAAAFASELHKLRTSVNSSNEEGIASQLVGCSANQPQKVHGINRTPLERFKSNQALFPGCKRSKLASERTRGAHSKNPFKKTKQENESYYNVIDFVRSKKGGSPSYVPPPNCAYLSLGQNAEVHSHHAKNPWLPG